MLLAVRGRGRGRDGLGQLDSKADPRDAIRLPEGLPYRPEAAAHLPRGVQDGGAAVGRAAARPSGRCGRGPAGWVQLIKAPRRPEAQGGALHRSGSPASHRDGRRARNRPCTLACLDRHPVGSAAKGPANHRSHGRRPRRPPAGSAVTFPASEGPAAKVPAPSPAAANDPDALQVPLQLAGVLATGSAGPLPRAIRMAVRIAGTPSGGLVQSCWIRSCSSSAREDLRQVPQDPLQPLGNHLKPCPVPFSPAPTVPATRLDPLQPSKTLPRDPLPPLRPARYPAARSAGASRAIQNARITQKALAELDLGGGGSNGDRAHRCTPQLQVRLADAFGLESTVGHDPTGASTWTLVEPHLFRPSSQPWAGTPLLSVAVLLDALRETTTTTGLRVRAQLLTNVYPRGCTVTDEAMASLYVEKPKTCPQSNYTIKPRWLGK
jgi:hypothetical protein